MEKQLYKTKWWDYRIIPARTADLVCVVEYVSAMRDYGELLGDSRYFDWLKGMDTEDPHSWKGMSIMRNVRKICDKNGWKYEEFWELAVESHQETRIKNTYINTFLNARVLKLIAEKWPDRFGRFIRYSQNPFFKASGWFGHRTQYAYYDSIIKSLQQADKRKFVATIKRLVDNNFISEEYLRKYIGEDGEEKCLKQDLSYAVDVAA